jgi:hypothetical protein
VNDVLDGLVLGRGLGFGGAGRSFGSVQHLLVSYAQIVDNLK